MIAGRSFRAGARIGRPVRAIAGPLASRCPPVGYAAASALAPVVPRRLKPDAAALAGLMAHLSARDAARAARQARRNWARYEMLLAALARDGLEAVRPLLVDDGGLSALAPPVLLCAFHVGPLLALAAALERVPGEVVVLRREAHPGWRRTSPSWPAGATSIGASRRFTARCRRCGRGGRCC